MLARLLLSFEEETQPKEEDKKNETPSSADSRVKASPLAKAIASDKGIDISKVHGSGDGGRIIKHDIETYSEQPSPTATATPIFTT